MIIKKKYTTIKKVNEMQIEDNDLPVSDIDKPLNPETLDEENEENLLEEVQPKSEENINDFDLNLDNIKFDQRQERREGTRRRGYRRSQDRNIITRAQQEAAAIKDAAKKEGYEEGIKNAQQDLEILKNNFSDFFNYKEEVFNKISESIMEVSAEIAKKILNKHIEADKEYIIPIIKGVLEEINKTENKITLKVMPRDVEIVKDKVTEIFEGNYFEAKVSVVPDAEIKEGGVKVETSNGIIDATIETQLSIIEKALKKKEEG